MGYVNQKITNQETINHFIFCYLDEDKHGLFKDMSENADIIEFWPSHTKDTKYNWLPKKLLMNYRMAKWGGWIFYNIHKYPFREDVLAYNIIIPTGSIGKLSLKYLSKIKQKHSNVRMYALLTDSMHAQSPHMNYVRDKLFSDVWDAVLTYDRYDAEEYGFHWFGFCYYSEHEVPESIVEKSDVYYVGFDKGNRTHIVKKLWRYLTKRGFRCGFDVVSAQKAGKQGNGFTYRKNKLDYIKVLQKVKGTNCILEVLQEGQQTQSIRYFEAIIYNKKLLTNNPNIVELPYYDSRYMKYFKSLKDIDLDWLRKKEKIDYQYAGEFSPVYLIDYIKNRF